MIRLASLAFAAVFALSAVATAQDVDASIAAGFKAGFMCSAVFIADRAPEDVLREELQGARPEIARVPDPVIDYANKAVTCEYDPDKPPRLAVHWDGFGTVLTPPGTTLADVHEMLPRVEMPYPTGNPAVIPWPDGDMLAKTAPPQGVDLDALEGAVDLAFSNPDYEPFKTLGVVIVHNDNIIAERYAPGWGMHTQYRTWSTAKSITNALVGIMVKDGKLDVNAAAPIPAWFGVDDPRSKITLNHLMHMSSGLKNEGSQTLRAYWGGIDVAQDAAASEFEVEPNTRWQYSNYDTLLLMRSIRNALGDNVAYWTLPRRALFNKIGMRDTIMEIDSFGNFISSSQVYTTPRDLARFGLLYLHDGVWQGERILPEGWVKYSTTPAPTKDEDGDDPGYGAQFWLSGADDSRLPGDTYTTAGARGQYSTIVPSHNLVVVRTGLDPLIGDNWDQGEFVAKVIDALE